jgi:hypothetical protein
VSAKAANGTLKLVAFKYPEPDETGDYKPGYEGLKDTKVRFSGPASKSLTTGANGEVSWDTAPGDYTFEAATPATRERRYLLVSYHLERDGGAQAEGKPGEKVPVASGKTTTLFVGYAPAAVLAGQIVKAPALGEQLQGETPLTKSNVKVKLFKEGGTTAIDSFHTDPNGRFRHVVEPAHLAGPLELSPDPEVKADGRTYRRERDRLLLVLEKGQRQDVTLRYQPTGAVVRVEPVQDNNVPLEGVTVRLVPRAAKSTETRSQTTGRGQIACTFADLPAGEYDLEFQAPSGFGRGSGKPERVFISLSGGQTLTLKERFTFTRQPGTVRGLVVAEGTGAGLKDVPLILQPADGGPIAGEKETDGEGRFRFEAPAGRYVVALRTQPILLENRSWDVTASGQPSRQVDVVAGETVTVDPPFLLAPDQHQVTVSVVNATGGPVEHAVVEVLNPREEQIDTFVTDEQGRYDWTTTRAGTYLFRLRMSQGLPDQLVPKAVASPHEEVQIRAPGASPLGGVHFTPFGPQGRGGNGSRAVQDLATYPVLTEEIDGAPAGRGGGGVAGGRSASQLVEGALRDVLGWRPRPTDPRGFIAALSQSFSCQEVQGHTECRWTPRTATVQIQADLGAITGAQASIYSRAKVALDAALPLLDGLYPLDPNADPEDLEATRSIIRSELSALVAELGIEGGPRVFRVDELFLELLGTREEPVTDPEDVGGQLGELRKRFGLERRRINTIEEEQNFTNFLILVDYVNGLLASWISQRGFFDGSSGKPFFGTQLVLLSRMLAVVGESVEEVEFTLDSVFIGGAERSTLRLFFPPRSDPAAFTDSYGQPLPLPPGTPSILLSELLDWVRQFATEDGPRLIQDAGKDGVGAFTPVLDRLRALVRGALTDDHGGVQDPDRLPDGYSTRRVQNALGELAKQLDEAHRLAVQVKRENSTGSLTL